MIDDMDLLAFGPTPWGERQLVRLIDRLAAREDKTVSRATEPLTPAMPPVYVACDTEGSGIMQIWSDRMLSRRFEARDVTAMTGVAEVRQRLIASRHFDFRESIKPDGKRRRWTWDGIQALMVFEAVMLHLKSAAIAEHVVRHLHDNQFFLNDASDVSDDLLLVYNLTSDKADIVQSSGLTAQYKWGDISLRPDALYVYNLSAMQRCLTDKLRDTGGHGHA